MDSLLFTVIGTVLSVTTASLTSSVQVTPANPPHEHWVNDSNDTRLLLGPTARSLKRGEAYIDDVSLFFPSVQVGLSDRVSIGIGTPVAVPFSDVHPGDAIWITPKVQVLSRQKTQVALGLVHVAAYGHHAGLAYGVATHGTSDGAVTLGVGLPYPGFERQRPVALVGAEKRVSPKVKLMTENYLGVGRGETILGGGMRIIRRRRTLDLSWFKFPGAPVYPLPIVRFSFQVSGPDQ